MRNTAIIYQSKYGSTEKYAKWISEAIDADLYKKSDISINILKQYDVIIYGAGLYLNKISGFSFIKNNYKYLENKKIIVFAVGISPYDTGIIFDIKEKNFPKEMKYIPCFYFRGAFYKSKIKISDQVKIKMFIKLLYNKETSYYEEWEREFINSFLRGGDWIGKENIIPIIENIKKIN